MANTNRLSSPEKAVYEAQRIPGTMTPQSFREQVHRALVNYYGSGVTSEELAAVAKECPDGENIEMVWQETLRKLVQQLTPQILKSKHDVFCNCGACKQMMQQAVEDILPKKSAKLKIKSTKRDLVKSR